MTSPTRCWIGVDGGGTRSRAMAGDAHGRELGAAGGGPGLIDASDPGGAVREVASVVQAAAAAAGVELPVRALWAGLAGSGHEGARTAAEEGLRDLGLAERVAVGSDVDAAHADAFGTGAGMLLVVGTGSNLRAVDPRGEVLMVGGWGALLGDEGSGYRVGLDGVRAVLRSADGREPETALTAALLSSTGTAGPSGLAAWAIGATKGEIAALFSPVATAARQGDTVAARVIHHALGGIRALMEAALARTSGWEARPPIAFVGGVVGEGGRLAEAVAEIASELGYEVLPGPVVPERGAVKLAIRMTEV
ncbi:MAG: hypothetical protein OXE96_01070 [Gemmatimonadetes bacterium]|nr:hypothetical protein [Gemmatimonadota bacterium]